MEQAYGNVYLIGMPGSGKSTIGRMLAASLNCPFVDMDDYIVKIAGETIPQLFAKGEDCFRDWETRACQELSGLPPAGEKPEKKRENFAGSRVIATGGGVIKRPENVTLLRESGRLVFLDRPVEQIAGDEEVDAQSRPLLSQDKNRVYALFKERYPLYQAAADLRVVNCPRMEDTVRAILTGLEQLAGEAGKREKTE